MAQDPISCCDNPDLEETGGSDWRFVSQGF